MDAELVSSCECTGQIKYDPDSGQANGECYTSFGRYSSGEPKYWCYVNEFDGCGDARYARRITGSRNLLYSFKACKGKPRPPPLPDYDY